MFAVKGNHTEVVSELLQAGADLTKCDWQGAPVLCICINNGGSVSTVEMLLRAGADVDAYTTDGRLATLQSTKAPICSLCWWTRGRE
jgi:ankyrin repeat protein